MSKGSQSRAMDRKTFMRFIANFGVMRPGAYDVPEFVLSAAFDSFLEGHGLLPVTEYEEALYFSWRAGNTIAPPVLSEDEITWLGAFFRGERYWLPEQVFSAEEAVEVELLFEQIVKQQRDREELEKSYQYRRKQANLAIRKANIRQAVLKRDKFRCKKCKATANLSVDHIVAVKNGGTDVLDNFQTLCRSCNSAKGCRS